LALVVMGLNNCLLCAAQPANKVMQTDPHWLARTPGSYIEGPKGEMVWNTNNYWQGVWKGGTNGWGVMLTLYGTNTPNAEVWVGVGRIKIVSGDVANCFCPPDGKFAKFELRTFDGRIVEPKEGKSLEEDYPENLAIGAYPRWPDGLIKALDFGIVTNGGPDTVGHYRLNDLYSITNEGIYTLTIRPVIYKDTRGVSEESNMAATNLFDRVDLPSVSAKIHLLPSQ